MQKVFLWFIFKNKIKKLVIQIISKDFHKNQFMLRIIHVKNHSCQESFILKIVHIENYLSIDMIYGYKKFSLNS